MSNNVLHKMGLVASIVIIIISIVGFFVCDDRFFPYLYFTIGFIYLMLILFFYKKRNDYVYCNSYIQKTVERG